MNAGLVRGVRLNVARFFFFSSPHVSGRASGRPVCLIERRTKPSAARSISAPKVIGLNVRADYRVSEACADPEGEGVSSAASVDHPGLQRDAGDAIMVGSMNISRSLALALAALSVSALLFGIASAGSMGSAHTGPTGSDMDQVQQCHDTASCDAVTGCPAHCSVVNSQATETTPSPGINSAPPSFVDLTLTASIASLHKPPPRLGLLS